MLLFLGVYKDVLLNAVIFSMKKYFEVPILPNLLEIFDSKVFSNVSAVDDLVRYIARKEDNDKHKNKKLFIRRLMETLATPGIYFWNNHAYLI